MPERRVQLSVESITKAYGATRILDRISLDVAAGEFLALIGPSGCGKSTLLRLISGLEAPDEGRIELGGRDVTVRAADRDVAMVFQSYALYPHLTARQNIALPLVMRRLTAAQRLPVLGRFFGQEAAARAVAAEVEAAAASLKISALLERKPARMSGGQRQRVALGRAIVRRPSLFLMDEPLSNLDVALRVHMQGELVDLHRRLGVTTIYVTHDQAEALSMADRVAVLMDGRLLQLDRPETLYRDPAHLDVAEFVGSPKINVLPGEIDRDGTVRLGPAVVADGFRLAAPGAVRLAIRPEHLELLSDRRQGSLPVRLQRCEYQGSEILAHLATQGGDRLVARLSPSEADVREDETLHVRAAPGRWLVFGPDGARLRPTATVLPAPAQAANRPVLAHG